MIKFSVAFSPLACSLLLLLFVVRGRRRLTRRDKFSYFAPPSPPSPWPTTRGNLFHFVLFSAVSGERNSQVLMKNIGGIDFAIFSVGNYGDCSAAEESAPEVCLLRNLFSLPIVESGCMAQRHFDVTFLNAKIAS